MSSHSEAIEHVNGATTKAFLTVWFALLFMTGIEVLLAYEQIPVLIFLTALVGLSVIKAALIIAYFMHLKFEKLSLFLTLFPMLILCIILMLVMFMPDSSGHDDGGRDGNGKPWPPDRYQCRCQCLMCYCIWPRKKLAHSPPPVR